MNKSIFIIDHLIHHEIFGMKNTGYMKVKTNILKTLYLAVTVLITACTASPSKPPAPQKPQINCSLTCENPIYIKPGNQPIPKRVTPRIRKSIGKEIQKTYDLLMPPDDATANPKEALKILNAINFNEANATERFNIHKFKAFSMMQLSEFSLARDEMEKAYNLSPQLSPADEIQSLKLLWQLHFEMKDYKTALEYINKWALLEDEIEWHEYYAFSDLFKELKDYTRAIANQQRGMEIAETKFGQVYERYFKLKTLYILNGDQKNAAKLEEIMVSLPNPRPLIFVWPAYPEEAKSQGIEGYCIVNFDINPTGSTENIHIKPGNCKTATGTITDLFTATSIKAVSRFKYAPKIDNGVPVYFRNAVYTVRYQKPE